MEHFSRLIAKAAKTRLTAPEASACSLTMTCAVCKHACYSVVKQDKTHCTVNGQTFMLYCMKKDVPVFTVVGFGKKIFNKYRELSVKVFEALRAQAPICTEVDPVPQLELQATQQNFSEGSLMVQCYGESILYSECSIFSAITANLPPYDHLMNVTNLLNERREAITARFSYGPKSFSFMVTAPIQSGAVFPISKIRRAWKNTGVDLTNYSRR